MRRVEETALFGIFVVVMTINLLVWWVLPAVGLMDLYGNWK
jgi:hypothetical protein